jgi:hypothetical protein
MNQISRICPVTDTDAERLVRPGTFADLGARITTAPPADLGARITAAPPADLGARITAAPPADLAPARPGRRPRRHRKPIRTPIGMSLAAVAAVIALVAAALAITRPSAPPKPATAPPPSVESSARPLAAQVLSFTTSGGYITVIVRNPLADPARYRAEFAAHHLNITLKMVPASPSIVGTVVYIQEPASSPDIETITAQGRCYTGGGGSACPVGVRIPVGFRGQAEVVFGRAARPGEQYESTASATAPGEVLHGLRFAGDTVAQVLALLRERHVTVPVFNYAQSGGARNVSHVPGTWYVYDADPWAPGQVLLFVGPTRTPPANQAPQPGTPVASPTS